MLSERDWWGTILTMLNRLTKLLVSFKPVLKNAVYLGIIDAVSLLMTLLALPYIIKTVGADNYGLIVFVQAIIAYFLVLVNFGFDFSAVKEVAEARSDKLRLMTIVESVVVIKALLAVFGYGVVVLLSFFIPQLSGHLLLVTFAYVACMADVLMLGWFFQGMEKLYVITIIRVSALLMYLGLLFLVVKEQGDYVYVPLLQGTGLVISSFIGFVYLLIRERMAFVKVHFSDLSLVFKKSMPFFVARVSVVTNNQLGKIVAGAVLGMTHVAVLDIALKICNFAFMPLRMIGQAAFPHNSHKKDRVFATRLFAVAILATLCVIVFVYVFAPFIVTYFAKGQLDEAIGVSRLLCIYILLGGCTIYMGASLLIAWGHSKEFNDSIIVSTIGLVILYALAWFGEASSVYCFAWIMITAEFIIFVYRLYYCLKYRIFSLTYGEPQCI